MSGDTVPVEIQDRLEALEARRLEIIAQNAVDRTAAEYAVMRIAERKAEKIRLKIEARALRLAVSAYDARGSEMDDLESLTRWEPAPSQPVDHEKIMVREEADTITEAQLGDLEIIEVPAEGKVPAEVPEVVEVEQPEGGVAGKEPLPEREPLSERILRLLKDAGGPLTRRDIATTVSEDPNRISTELSHMKRRKLVAPVEGHGHGWSVL